MPVGSLSLSCFVLQIHLILEINPKLQKAPSILKNSTLFVYDFCFTTIQFILCMDTDCIQYSSNTMHECTMPILERESTELREYCLLGHFMFHNATFSEITIMSVFLPSSIVLLIHIFLPFTLSS